MAASATDKFKKLSAKWTGNIGAAGVSNGTVTTIPLTSTSNLATDTAVVATINRVDSNGAKTTGGVDETIIGVVSGNNLINCVRGVEGTAQAHAAGQVVEILVTAKGYNDLIDGILVEHGQDGVHTSALVTSLKASGAVVNTGTSDVTIVTPKALADSTIAKTKASGAEVDTGTDDAKFVTAKAVADSKLSYTDGTETLTNKRIEPRIVTAASYTTDTGTSLSVATADIFQVTAQAGALKFNNPGGTPAAGQKLIIRIKDDGTARALTYDTQFRTSSDLALPTTTVLGKTLYMGFIYNTTDTKWDLIAVLNNF